MQRTTKHHRALSREFLPLLPKQITPKQYSLRKCYLNNLGQTVHRWTHLQSFVGVCAAQMLLDESSGICKHDCLLLTTAKPAATLSSPRGSIFRTMTGQECAPTVRRKSFAAITPRGVRKQKQSFADLSGESADLLKRSLSRLPPVDCTFAR